MRRTLQLIGMFILFVPVYQGLRIQADESLWIEAEHLEGIRGYCWPMGRPEMKETNGHWGLSGPGWAAEWNQGGESGFLSIATAANDERAVATKILEVPVDGTYFVWVRYGDWREKTERFQIRIEQEGAENWTGHFGESARVEEDNVMKLYWGWAFAWDRRETALKKGPAKLSLLSTTQEPEPRQIDAIVLTTDPAYRPLIKERPHKPGWDILESWRKGVPEALEPLARQRPEFRKIPEQWRLHTFQDKGFLYLWNVIPDLNTWLSDAADRIPLPYRIGDEDVRKEFEAKYAGQKEGIPIFSDPRIVPTFHGVGPVIFRTDPETGELTEEGRRFAKWLDDNPQRQWATMMNYHPGNPVGPEGIEMFTNYRNRYVGGIAGENLGYFSIPPDEMKEATAGAGTRRELADAISSLSVKYNAEKYRQIYGKDLDQNPFQDVISCLSVGNILFAPLLSDWGCRTVGYESSAMTSSILNMRWAFMRGIGRQGGHVLATYRSCNFGDSATMFSNMQSYHTPQNILDNFYSVYSGAGMTWYKMDIWYQYMAGSSIFYHEQGHDEWWKPGGTTAAGVKETQLSPKGKLVDRFLRVTKAHPDRGVPFTPVAFLVDYAHGWEPSPYWPNSFKNFHQNQDKFLYGIHEKMLEEYFCTAYYPIGPESEKPITGTNEVYLPGVFGDMFDVIFAYPGVKRWTTIDTYPVVIVAGEIELTKDEGARLANYVRNGGTLFIAGDHLSGPGVDELNLPSRQPVSEADRYRWLDDPTEHPSPRFRFQTLELGDKGRPLGVTPDGKAFCASFDRGQGRLIYLSVPYGLSITQQALPVLPRLFAHLTRGLMPVEVDGDVQWLVNKTSTGWLVTLLNPAGQLKPQQGVFPTDFRKNRTVTIRAHVPLQSATDRLLPTDKFPIQQNSVSVEVPAGGVRIIELK